MITIEEAKKAIVREVKVLPSIRVPLGHALDRVLACDVKATVPLPLEDNSAMDGFALKSADTVSATSEHPIHLRIMGTRRAGDGASSLLRSGETIRIMTGATIPPGADAVVMKEAVEKKGGGIFLTHAIPSGNNIRRRGEEIRKGSVGLTAGTVLHSRAIGLMANLGLNFVPVHRPPRVAVVVTGSELLAPKEKRRKGKIYDSNTPMLLAALKEISLEPILETRVGDEKKKIRKVLQKVLNQADVVLLVGGVSVGDYDFSKSVLAQLKVRTIFWKVAQKPGKPLFFGKKGRTLVFGLPGNPVSVWVCFHEYVRLALAAMQGQRADPLTDKAILESEVKPHPSMAVFLRGVSRRDNGHRRVRPLEGQGSHMLKALAEANCLIQVPIQKGSFPSGTEIEIHSLTREGK